MKEDFSKINYSRSIDKIIDEYNNKLIKLNKVDGKINFDKPQYDINTGELVSPRLDVIDPEHVRLDILKRKETLDKLQKFYELIK